MRPIDRGGGRSAPSARMSGDWSATGGMASGLGGGEGGAAGDGERRRRGEEERGDERSTPGLIEGDGRDDEEAARAGEGAGAAATAASRGGDGGDSQPEEPDASEQLSSELALPAASAPGSAFGGGARDKGNSTGSSSVVRISSGRQRSFSAVLRSRTGPLRYG